MQNWLSSVVITYGLCPFAKYEFESGRIHYEVIEAEDLESQLKHIILQCAFLDKNRNIETCLLIFAVTFSDFEDYLNMLEITSTLLLEQGYEGVYQLAGFTLIIAL